MDLSVKVDSENYYVGLKYKRTYEMKVRELGSLTRQEMPAYFSVSYSDQRYHALLVTSRTAKFLFRGTWCWHYFVKNKKIIN